MAAAKRKYVRLDPAAWAEIEALWQVGEVTLGELSGRFGASERTLQAHFRKAGIQKGEKAAAMAAAVKAAVLDAEMDDQALLVSRARAVRERSYAQACRVEDLIMAQLQLAETDPSQVLRVNSSLKALSLAASSLERLHQLKHRALGLDRDDVFDEEIPALVIRDISGEEAQRMREERDDDGAFVEEDGGDDDLVDDESDDDVVYLVDEETAEAEVEQEELDDEGFRMCRDATRKCA